MAITYAGHVRLVKVLIIVTCYIHDLELKLSIIQIFTVQLKVGGEHGKLLDLIG